MNAGSVNLEGAPPSGLPGLSSLNPGTSTNAENAARGQAAEYVHQMLGPAATQSANSAVERATGLLRAGATEIRVFVEHNHYSVHALSLIGGLALCVVSALSMVNVFYIVLSPLAYLFSCYGLMFGLVLCVIDGPADRAPVLQRVVLENAPFLLNNKGRSLFYLFVATFVWREAGFGLFGLSHMVLGCYFLGIGVLHIALTLAGSGTGSTTVVGVRSPTFQQQGPREAGGSVPLTSAA